ncbi:MAG: hypothetical protein M1831_005595 [Alyxoria varia]|nr:MAG: hypothetical protein M1831_005595 [Alyxoria varia]
MNNGAACSSGASVISKRPSDARRKSEASSEANWHGLNTRNGGPMSGSHPICDKDCHLHVPSPLVNAKWKDVSHLRIDFHLNYDIIQKHNELSLIEQELAKCMISLEQLRRCHLVPDPEKREGPEPAAPAASSPEKQLKSRLRANPKKTKKASGDT